MKKLAFLTICALIAISGAQADIDNMDIGGDLTAMYFFGSDVLAKDSETDFLRTEGHLWFQADLDDNVMARISLEFDRALDQTQNGATNTLNANFTGNLDLFLEEAFVKVADIAGSGFSVSVGRQFINLGDNQMADNYNKWWGDGFIIADAAPQSPALFTDLGSYEIDPFDAIVVSYEMEDFTLSGVYARASEDFNNFVNDDVAATVLYGSYYGIEGHQLDVYFAWVDNNASPIISDSYTVGARAAGDITETVAYKLEVAYQFQDEQQNLNAEVNALAIQAGINYHPDTEYNPNIGFIYTFLEGDNGDGFRALDGKNYGLLTESMAFGQITNANIFNLTGGFEPMEDVAWTADLFYTLLDDEVAVGATTEDDGGFEIDSQIDYQFNDNLRTFVGGGIYWIGDAFGRDDEAYFFRTGLKVAF